MATDALEPSKRKYPDMATTYKVQLLLEPLLRITAICVYVCTHVCNCLSCDCDCAYLESSSSDLVAAVCHAKAGSNVAYVDASSH